MGEYLLTVLSSGIKIKARTLQSRTRHPLAAALVYDARTFIWFVRYGAIINDDQLGA